MRSVVRTACVWSWIAGVWNEHGLQMSGFPVAQGWSPWPAPAKLNLFLRIVGRRPDGYHELQTVFRLLDWGDTVHLRSRADGVIARVGAGAEGVAEADDLLVRAAKILQLEANCRQGIDIGIEKRTPMGGGFGGGSSDAATVLVALNLLWGLDFDMSRLAALGLRLGADVPVFVHGRNAWAEGVGERLTAIELPPAMSPHCTLDRASSPVGNGQSKTSTGQSALLASQALSHRCGSSGRSEWLISNNGGPLSWRLL